VVIFFSLLFFDIFYHERIEKVKKLMIKARKSRVKSRK